MRHFSLAILAATLVSLAACSTLVVTPAATPAPPVAATPSPLPPTASPGGVVSATPRPPGEEPLGSVPLPFAPQPGDERLVRGNVFIDSTEIIMAESFPPQFFLHITGSLPNPCHQLRVSVSIPDAQSRIVVEVYSLADPDTACIAVIQPLDVSVPLGSLPAGKYEVWVNGQPVGEIEAP
ncbi:MAG: hypothetical protein AAB382_01685 [Chloroflexota bacterium]